jgi:acyl-CoA thioesterase
MDNKIKEFLDRDKFARFVGIELVDVTPGRAVARMTIQDHHRNGVGTVQGGAIVTLADLTFAAAANSYGTVAVAINIAVSFLQPGLRGVLTATAEEISASPRLATYLVRVQDDAGQIIALFQGTVYRKKETLDQIAAPRR